MSPDPSEQPMSNDRPYQATLANLLVWVLGSAIFLTLVRGATGFMATTPAAPTLRRFDVDRVFVVVLLAPAILIAARLAADAVRLIAAKRTERRRSVVFGAAYRAAAVGYLAALALAASEFLRSPTEAGQAFGIFDEVSWRIALAALGLAIGSIGLGLAFVPSKPNRRARPRRTWVGGGALFAGIAGLLAIASMNMIIPYHVLIAIESVKNAMHRPGMMYEIATMRHAPNPILTDAHQWHSMHRRLIEAGIEAAIGMAACMFTAHWLGRDLRRSGEDAEAPRSTLGMLYRAGTTVLVWLAWIYLAFVGIETLSPPMAEGFAALIHPTGTWLVVPSLAVLAAGLSARGISGPTQTDPASVEPSSRSPIDRISTWARIAVRTGIVVGLVFVILAAVHYARRPLAEQVWYVPWSLPTMLGSIRSLLTFTTPTTVYLSIDDTPEALVLFVGAIAVFVLSAKLLLWGRLPGREAPTDVVARSPRRIGRFLGAWFAMTGVMLCLFPVLFLGGMAVVHLTLRTFYP